MIILTDALVRKAIELSLPSIRGIVREYTWGPMGLVIVAGGKGISPIIHTMSEIGDRKEWNDRWEGRDFTEFASCKMTLSLEYGQTSGELVEHSPWLLRSRDFIYQGGVAKDTGLAVGCSGAYGETDETCAWIVWHSIQLLCQRKIADMRADKQNRVD